jgi:DNA-directed RNA polymerase subunit H (RpoH/RPB5)
MQDGRKHCLCRLYASNMYQLLVPFDVTDLFHRRHFATLVLPLISLRPHENNKPSCFTYKPNQQRSETQATMQRIVDIFTAQHNFQIVDRSKLTTQELKDDNVIAARTAPVLEYVDPEKIDADDDADESGADGNDDDDELENALDQDDEDDLDADDVIADEIAVDDIAADDIPADDIPADDIAADDIAADAERSDDDDGDDRMSTGMCPDAEDNQYDEEDAEIGADTDDIIDADDNDDDNDDDDDNDVDDDDDDEDDGDAEQRPRNNGRKRQAIRKKKNNKTSKKTPPKHQPKQQKRKQRQKQAATWANFLGKDVFIAKVHKTWNEPTQLDGFLVCVPLSEAAADVSFGKSDVLLIVKMFTSNGTIAAPDVVSTFLFAVLSSQARTVAQKHPWIHVLETSTFEFVKSENRLVPRYKLLNELQVNRLLRKKRVCLQNLPKMLETDAIRKFYMFPPGSVVYAVDYDVYRLCV